MEKILVSIICPVFNRIELIKECIDSVAAQNYSNWELIVIDDDSDDGTYEYIQERSSNDDRIKVYRKNGSRGAPSSRNIGIKISKGKYLIFLDSDDVLSSSCLRDRVLFMEKNQTLDFSVYPQQVFHKEAGDSNLLVNIKTKEDELDRFLTIGQSLDVPWVTCSVIWKKSSIIMKNISWDEEILGFQDVQFNVAALTSGMKYQMLEDVATDSFWRRHSGARIGLSLSIPEATGSHEKLLLDIWKGLRKNKINHEKRRVRILKSVITLCFSEYILNREYIKANKLLKMLVKESMVTKNEKMHLYLRVLIGKLSRYSLNYSYRLERKIVSVNKEFYKPLGAGNFLKHNLDTLNHQCL